MFAAAFDFSTSRLVDYKSVECDYPTFVFDVTSAYTHAEEDELIFLKPPPEWIEEKGARLWRAKKIIYGRRKEGTIIIYYKWTYSSVCV